MRGAGRTLQGSPPLRCLIAVVKVNGPRTIEQQLASTGVQHNQSWEPSEGTESAFQHLYSPAITCIPSLSNLSKIRPSLGFRDIKAVGRARLGPVTRPGLFQLRSNFFEPRQTAARKL